MNRHNVLLLVALTAAGVSAASTFAHADLIGYWSADSTAGQGTILPNDQGDRALDGELVGGAQYTPSGQGHTGDAGDYAVSFPGTDDDYAVIPPTERTFGEFTITAWIKGIQMGDWAGIVVSRDPVQPIGIDYHAFNGELNYIWNNNSSATWGFVSGLLIPDDEWTFVALTVVPEEAALWVGPRGGVLESAVNAIEHLPQDNFHEWRWAEDDCCGPSRNFSGLIDDVSIWDEALTEDDLRKLHSGAAAPLTLRGPSGDFNNDGTLDAVDIDLLSAEVRAGTNRSSFDVTADGKVDDADRTHWVHVLRKTWFGDANMDGQFNSTDLVFVFQKGKYEDGVDGNSGWADGDWNGDADFTSGDFVTAFQDGGYEVGPRPASATVPEPAFSGIVLLGLAGVCSGARRR